MRIAVWEFDDARWPTIQSACLACKARADRFTDARPNAHPALARYDAAIIALREPSDGADPLLGATSQLHAAGVRVIVHGENAASWTISAKCRALLTGARHLLDNSATDFSRSLQDALYSTLQVLREQRDEECRVRELARNNGIVGQSAALLSAFRQVIRVSKLSDLPVLITGESGTGKELFASAIHSLDPKRCERELIAVNCAAINTGVAESELFGHQRGAFTGAARDHGGLFFAAQGGVLFLDEIGELSLDLQAKILRVLQEKRVRRLGGSAEEVVDVRVVAATNQDLPQMIRDGRFRNDLFHRLNSLSIHVAPLRERGEDLIPLVEHFLGTHCSWKQVREIEPDFIDALSQLKLPGNVRELRNLITTSLAAKTDDTALGLKDLPTNVLQEMLQSRYGEADSLASVSVPDGDGKSGIGAFPLPANDAKRWDLSDYLLQCERKIVMAAMERVKNNQSQAARLLGVTPRSVYNKLRKHQLLDKPLP